MGGEKKTKLILIKTLTHELPRCSEQPTWRYKHPISQGIALVTTHLCYDAAIVEEANELLEIVRNSKALCKPLEGTPAAIVKTGVHTKTALHNGKAQGCDDLEPRGRYSESDETLRLERFKEARDELVKALVVFVAHCSKANDEGVRWQELSREALAHRLDGRGTAVVCVCADQKDRCLLAVYNARCDGT